MKFKSSQPGDFQAYVELMIAHQDSLRAFIYSLMPGSSDTDDVLQNTNAVLWQKRERFKAGTNFQAWAFKIARYQTRHQLDRYKRDGRLVIEQPHERQMRVEFTPLTKEKTSGSEIMSPPTL